METQQTQHAQTAKGMAFVTDKHQQNEGQIEALMHRYAQDEQEWETRATNQEMETPQLQLRIQMLIARADTAAHGGPPAVKLSDDIPEVQPRQNAQPFGQFPNPYFDRTAGTTAIPNTNGMNFPPPPRPKMSPEFTPV